MYRYYVIFGYYVPLNTVSGASRRVVVESAPQVQRSKPLHEDPSFKALVSTGSLHHLYTTVVIQVGANEGATDNDPLYHIARRHKNFRGVLVEPVGELYRKLERNYEEVPGEWTFEQALMGRTDGDKQSFHYLSPSGLAAWCKEHNQTVPWWGTQLGSTSVRQCRLTSG